MSIFENSKYTNEILDFKFPRYEELYMDQVLSFIEDTLKVFNTTEKEKVITSSMVNNYVKQGLVSPPIKKKYTKNHIAYIIVVCVLKQILSISEICSLIEIQIDSYPIQNAYNYFAEWIEKALEIAFTNEKDILKETDNTGYEARIVRLASKSFANKIYLQKYLQYKNQQKDK